MQLNLFTDNRRTIRLNDADQLLRALRLKESLDIYAELLADAPQDAELLARCGQVQPWCQRLATFSSAPADPARLHALWLELTPQTPASLATALYQLLIDELQQLPDPERIYRPPRFHLGTLLMNSARFAEAEDWFARALQSDIGPRGRFLAWRGDALTRLNASSQAKAAYLAAFLEGPYEVELTELQSSVMHDLLCSLEYEDHGLDVIDLKAWLPVWGWLQGVFSLPLNALLNDRAAFVNALDAAHQADLRPRSRLWFDDLCYAEYLRTRLRDDPELIRIRRRLRQSNGFIFNCYLEKLRSASEPGAALFGASW